MSILQDRYIYIGLACLKRNETFFMAWWTCFMVTIMLSKLQCLFQFVHVCLSPVPTQNPTHYSSVTWFCALEGASSNSGAHAIHGGSWWGLKRGKRNKNTVPIDLQNLWLPSVKHIQRDRINLLYLRAHWIIFDLHMLLMTLTPTGSSGDTSLYYGGDIVKLAGYVYAFLCPSPSLPFVYLPLKAHNPRSFSSLCNYASEQERAALVLSQRESKFTFFAQTERCGSCCHGLLNTN